MVAQGDYIKQGQPLLKIANLNTVWASFDVYENQINLFKKGQEISVITNAYANKVFKGKVDFIDPVLNAKTRTVSLRVVLNNKAKVFKPGMFVEGEIKGIILNQAQVVTIPTSAVLWTGKRSVVYVKPNPNQPVFEMREITLGNKIGNKYEILKGLKNKDEIVTNGAFTVDAAAQLQGKKSMMNKNGGKTTTGHEGHLGMDNKASKKESNYTNMNKRLIVSEKFQEQLKVVFNDYIQLKNALVKEDSNKVKATAKKALGNLSKVDMELLSEKEAHKHWMSIEKEIKTAATSISNTSKIEEQRTYFKSLSTHLTNAIEIFGINKKVYQQFCPMENSKGAYWLSTKEKVVNPYFGEAMLTCGEVQRVIE